MGRWRAPGPKSSNYISVQGAKALKQELYQLWKIERPEVTRTVSEAAKNGDRSENGDYIYGKRRLREIDARVRYLTKRLDTVQVVDNNPTDITKIYFGASVQLLNLDNDEVVTGTLLGADEIDSTTNTISIDSPLAKNLLGKKVGDDITVEVAGKVFHYCIEQINYQ